MASSSIFHLIHLQTMFHLPTFPLVPFYTTPTNPPLSTNSFEPSNLNLISTQSLSSPISTQIHIFRSHGFHPPTICLFVSKTFSTHLNLFNSICKFNRCIYKLTQIPSFSITHLSSHYLHFPHQFFI